MSSAQPPEFTSEEAFCVDMIRTQMEFVTGNIDWLADRLCNGKENTIKFNQRLREKNQEMVGFLSTAEVEGLPSSEIKKPETPDAMYEMLMKMLSHHANTVVALYDVVNRKMHQVERQVFKERVVQFYASHKLARAVARLEKVRELYVPGFLMAAIDRENERICALEDERCKHKADKKQKQKEKKKRQKQKRKEKKGAIKTSNDMSMEKDVEDDLDWQLDINLQEDVTLEQASDRERVSRAPIPKAGVDFAVPESLIETLTELPEDDLTKAFESLPRLLDADSKPTSESHNSFDKLKGLKEELDKLPSEGPLAGPSNLTTTSVPPVQTPRPVKPLPRRRSTKTKVTEDDLLAADYRWLDMNNTPGNSQTTSAEDSALHAKKDQGMNEWEFDLRRLSYVMMTSPSYNSKWFLP